MEVPVDDLMVLVEAHALDVRALGKLHVEAVPAGLALCARLLDRDQLPLIVEFVGPLRDLDARDAHAFGDIVLHRPQIVVDHGFGDLVGLPLVAVLERTRRERPGREQGQERASEFHDANTSVPLSAENGLKLRLGFHSRASRTLHSLSKRAAARPFQSSTSLALDGRWACARYSRSPST